MINSRALADLHPKVSLIAQAHVNNCKKKGVDLLITCTYRDAESQDKLYAQGRTEPGKVVTNAQGGQSFHQYRVAYDVVPLVNGKPVWNTDHPAWTVAADEGKKLGLEWAGDWKKFKEFPHFQYTGGLTIADFQRGAKL